MFTAFCPLRLSERQRLKVSPSREEEDRQLRQLQLRILREFFQLGSRQRRTSVNGGRLPSISDEDLLSFEKTNSLAA